MYVLQQKLFVADDRA